MVCNDGQQIPPPAHLGTNYEDLQVNILAVDMRKTRCVLPLSLFLVLLVSDVRA